MVDDRRAGQATGERSLRSSFNDLQTQRLPNGGQECGDRIASRAAVAAALRTRRDVIERILKRGQLRRFQTLCTP